MIALDVDDVLAAFCQHAADYYKKPLCKQDYWCIKTMDAYYGEGWFTNIRLVPEFWATMPRLSHPEEIDFEFHYYLSAFPEEMYHIRKEWLTKNGFPDKELICSHDKLTTCLEKGINVLVDDKPDMIRKLQGTSVKGIHFITPYAGFEPVGDYVVTNLNQVNQYL